jgi:ribosomal-protein-alanine N-acetyltransferase
VTPDFATGKDLDVAGSGCCIRSYRESDAGALRDAADDILVARYMYSGFPQPYTERDARSWITHALSHDPLQYFVIEVGGALGGGVGVSPHGHNDDAVGLIGYWLSPRYWGRGIATAAVREIVNYSFASGFRRLQATVFAPNLASSRVLVKNGFCLEGRLREARFDAAGGFMDELIYGLLKPPRR